MRDIAGIMRHLHQTMMTRRILFTVALVLFIAQAQAQFRAGVKGGISTFDVSAGELVITDEAGADAYLLGIDQTKIGVHLGFFVQAFFKPIFVQPELLFNSNTVSYKFTEIGSGDVEIRDESYQTIDFPLMLGVKFGPVRIGGGPMGHLFLNSNSDIDDFLGEDLSLIHI